MNANYIDLKNSNKITPTLVLNKEIGFRKNITFLTELFFITSEFILMLVLYFLLYEYRIAEEFNRNINFLDYNSPRFLNYCIFFIISSILYFTFIYRYRIYKLSTSAGLADELFKMAKSFSLAILLTIGVSFLLKYIDLSRLVITSYWLAALLLISILRGFKRLFYTRLANKDVICKKIIIVGAGKIGKSLISEINSNKSMGYKVIGFVDDIESQNYSNAVCLGKITNLKEIIQQIVVDEIIITIPSERQLVNSIINDFRKLDIKIKIIPDLFNLVMSTIQVGNISSLPVVTLVKTPMQGFGFFIKRIVDIIASSLLLLIISPVLIITAVAIKLNSKGPVFYTQKRIGKNGQMFNMYKFRSMVINADSLIEKLVHLNEADGIAFKIKDDPRITKVGKFIRKYSIDELPQLLNVLLGDMSLVGPRPPLLTEVEKYGDWEWRRLEVLPGITGLWQISGRSDLSFQQWMNLDVYYIENWSLGLDLKILLKTLPVVIKGEGAY